jgi:hypothetical protein
VKVEIFLAFNEKYFNKNKKEILKIAIDAASREVDYILEESDIENWMVL